MPSNIYDPTQDQGEGLDLEQLLQDPDFVSLLSKMGYLPDESAMPGGRNIAGTFQAAHPLEFAASLAQNILHRTQGPKMNRALAAALRGRGPAAGGGSIPSTWGYNPEDFSPGGTHEGY